MMGINNIRLKNQINVGISPPEKVQAMLRYKK
jgi:hypothetical protein